MYEKIINNNSTTSSLDLWQETLRILEKRISRENLQVWFQAIRGYEFAEGKLSLFVPSKYYQDWISSHFLEDIMNAVEEITGQRIIIQFQIGELGLRNRTRDLENAESGEPTMRRIEERSTLYPYTYGSIHQVKSGVISQDQYRGETFERSYLNPRYTFETFVVGASNRLAQAAALAVAQNPAKQYNPLFLYGGVGLGKTHLMQAIGHYIQKTNPQAKVVYITSEKFLNAFIYAMQSTQIQEFNARYRNVDILIIDDIQFIAGKEQTQEVFFHTFNALHEASKQIVVSSDRPPKEIPTLEERLRSRFEWGLIADIQPPDFETRVAILKKKAYQDRISIPDEVTYYIAENITSNIRELEGCLVKLGATAAFTSQPITLEMAKTALSRLLTEKKVATINIELIQKRVAAYYNITLEELLGQKRTKGIVQPRQVAMYLCRNLTNCSFPEIGAAFGKRDHTTVIHACNKIEQDLQTDANFRRVVNHIIQQIKE
ncbi:MAG: chromosomal replication initiator protein DnaA [bacterium]|nr:chromosomal replication initiator protein DnaA [bacterium]